VATSLEQIQSTLASARETGTKPVSMAEIPEATIDVKGGVSSALEIEPLGQKKKKKNEPIIQSSTASMATDEYFSDLLEGINYNDPSSVQNFKDSVSDRLTGADFPTVASLSAAPPEQQTVSEEGGDDPFGQFEDYFGESTRDSIGGQDLEEGQYDWSGSYMGDTSLPSSEAYEEFASMSRSSQNTAVGLMSSLPSMAVAASRGTGWGDLAMGYASKATGLPSYNSFMNSFNVTDAYSAINAANSAVNLAKTVSAYDKFTSMTKGLESFIGGIANKFTQTLDGVMSVVTNPTGALEAVGRNLEYGTQNPEMRSFNLPSGPVSFVFDETGRLTTPGLVGMMVAGTPVASAYGLAQFGMNASGYVDEISQRAHGMVDAFSLSGTSYGEGVTGYSTPDGSKSFVDLDFSSYAANYGSEATNWNNQLDISSMSGTLGSQTAQDFEVASVVQSYVDFDVEEDFAQAHKEALANQAIGLGIVDSYAEAMNMEMSGEGSLSEAVSKSNIESNTEIMEAISGAFSEKYGVSLQDLSPTSDMAAMFMSDTQLSAQTTGVKKGELDVGVSNAIGLDKELVEAVSTAQISMIGDYSAQAAAGEATKLSMALNAPVSVAITSEGQAIADLSGTIDTLGDAHNYGDIHSAAGSAAHDLANATTSITGDLTFNPEYNEVDKQVATDLATAASNHGKTVGEIATATKSFGGTVAELDQFMSDVDEAVEAESKNTDTSKETQDLMSAYGEAEGDTSDSDSKVICTELHRQGLLPYDLWRNDGKYGKTLPLHVRKGYWLWGVPIANAMANSKAITKIVKPVATCVAKEMAYRTGYGQGSTIGEILLNIGLPICSIMGRFNKNGNYRTTVS